MKQKQTNHLPDHGRQQPAAQFRWFAATLLTALLAAPAAQAVDYNYGSATNAFTITASDQARVQGAGVSSGGSFSDSGFGGVYDRGADRDAIYMHFNLAPLGGGTIAGNVNLNLTIWANWGGEIYNGIIGTPATSWSYPGSAPGMNAFTPVTAPNANYGDGTTATWTLSDTTFQGFVDNPGTFYGLGITAGAGSHAHFSGPGTLTGTNVGPEVRVLGATDWSLAAYDSGTKTLAITNTDNVSGGDVLLFSGTTLAVGGDATLDSGSFAGNFNNSGALAFGSSAAQTLTGTISGPGSLTKTGNGELTLQGFNSQTGGTTINGGTLVAAKSKQDNGIHTLGYGPLTINNGGTLRSTTPWSTSSEWDGTTVGAITVNQGGTWSIEAVGQTIRNGLYLNGGTITATVASGDWGALHLKSDVTASNNAVSTIEADTALSGSKTITVAGGSQLNYSGNIHNQNGTSSGITKTGSGTLILSGAATYTGATTVNEGTLQIGDGVTDGSVAGPISTTTNGALVFNVASAQTYNNSIIGSGGLTKQGPGTLALSGANTYFGQTRVQAGVLSIDALSGLPGGRLDITNGAVVSLNFSGQALVSELILNGVSQSFGTYGATGSGATTIDDTHFTGSGVVKVMVVPGNQVLTWTGAVDNNWDATTANWTNSLQINTWFNNASQPNSALFGAQGAGAVNLNLPATFYASNLTFNAAGYTLGGGALALGNTPAVVANADVTISSAVDGSGGVVKSGNGTLTLSGVNNYPGTTTVNAGVLAVAGAGQLGGGSYGASIVNSGVLAFASTANQNYSGSISGSGVLIKDGAGQLNLSGLSTFTNITTIKGGMINVQRAGGALSGPITITNGGQLLSSTDWGTDSSRLITVEAGGTLTAGHGPNSIGVGLVLEGGTVDATGTALSNPNGNWGNFVFQNTASLLVRGTTTSIMSADIRVNGPHTFDVESTGDPSGIDLYISGKLSHIEGVAWGSVTKIGNGTMAVSNPANNPGSYTVTAGKLLFIDNMAGGGNGGLINNATVESQISSASAYGNPISGSGTLLKTGAGTLTLSGNNSGAQGPVRVTEGILSLSAATAFPGTSLNTTNAAKVDLNYTGTKTVSQLTLDGVVQANGTYGSSSSPATHQLDAFFTGTGVIQVYVPPTNQVLTWTAATDNNWDSSTANWTNSFPYTQWYNSSTAPNSAIFGATGAGAVNVALGGALHAGSLTFNAAGYDLGGGALTLGNTPAWVVNSDATLSSVVNGVGGLNKTGNGKLTLTGANSTYSGPTTVGTGTLEIAGAGGFDPNVAGGALTVSNGATVQITTTANNALAFQGGTPAWTVAGTLNVTGGGANSIPSAGLVLNNGTLTGTGSNPWGTFLTIQGNPSVTANGTNNVISSQDFAIFTGQTLGLNTPLAGDMLVASSAFNDVTGQGAGSLRKTGLGTVTLNGASSYTGSTTVSSGTLLVNGSVAAGASVNGGTLGGSGTISGAVTVETNGTLTAGSTLGAVGTLNLGNDLNLNAGANVLVNLNKSLAQSNSVMSLSSGLLVNNGGSAVTLTVSNLGPALVVGDKFQVFSKAFDQDGGLVTIVAPAGYAFSNGLAVDGSVTVTGVPSTTPPALSYTKSGGNLTFTWDGAGSLEWQTNSLSTGLGTNWVPYPNGTNGVTVTIDPARPSVFFRVKQ